LLKEHLGPPVKEADRDELRLKSKNWLIPWEAFELSRPSFTKRRMITGFFLQPLAWESNPEKITLKAVKDCFSRLPKNAHLLRFPHPSSLRLTAKYAYTSGFRGLASGHF